MKEKSEKENTAGKEEIKVTETKEHETKAGDATKTEDSMKDKVKEPSKANPIAARLGPPVLNKKLSRRKKKKLKLKAKLEPEKISGPETGPGLLKNENRNVKKEDNGKVVVNVKNTKTAQDLRATLKNNSNNKAKPDLRLEMKYKTKANRPGNDYRRGNNRERFRGNRQESSPNVWRQQQSRNNANVLEAAVAMINNIARPMMNNMSTRSTLMPVANQTSMQNPLMRRTGGGQNPLIMRRESGPVPFRQPSQFTNEFGQDMRPQPSDFVPMLPQNERSYFNAQSESHSQMLPRNRYEQEEVIGMGRSIPTRQAMNVDRPVQEQRQSRFRMEMHDEFGNGPLPYQADMSIHRNFENRNQIERYIQTGLTHHRISQQHEQRFRDLEYQEDMMRLSQPTFESNLMDKRDSTPYFYQNKPTQQDSRGGHNRMGTQFKIKKEQTSPMQHRKPQPFLPKPPSIGPIRQNQSQPKMQVGNFQDHSRFQPQSIERKVRNDKLRGFQDQSGRNPGTQGFRSAFSDSKPLLRQEDMDRKSAMLDEANSWYANPTASSFR